LQLQLKYKIKQKEELMCGLYSPIKERCYLDVLKIKKQKSKEIYDLCELPELGVVPKYMHAQVIRASRFGQPKSAFKLERIPVPEVGPHGCLLYVMAAGINYNNVFSASGKPVDVITARNKKK
jgi:hypothetical protein